MSIRTRLRAWRTRRFLATLPPIATADDGGEWLIGRFQRDTGRDFNPWSSTDRETIRVGLRRALISSLAASKEDGR